MDLVRARLARAVILAAVAIVAALAPASSATAAESVAYPLAQQSVCSTVASIAGPILQLVELRIIDLDEAVARIAALTGLPVDEVVACLGL